MICLYEWKWVISETLLGYEPASSGFQNHVG